MLLTINKTTCPIIGKIGLISPKYGKHVRFFLMFFWGEVMGALILPKWLINVPGPIAILFRRFMELRKFHLL